MLSTVFQFSWSLVRNSFLLQHFQVKETLQRNTSKPKSCVWAYNFFTSAQTILQEANPRWNSDENLFKTILGINFNGLLCERIVFNQFRVKRKADQPGTVAIFNKKGKQSFDVNFLFFFKGTTAEVMGITANCHISPENFEAWIFVGGMAQHFSNPE